MWPTLKTHHRCHQRPHLDCTFPNKYKSVVVQQTLKNKQIVAHIVDASGWAELT